MTLPTYVKYWHLPDSITPYHILFFEILCIRQSYFLPQISVTHFHLLHSPFWLQSLKTDCWFAHQLICSFITFFRIERKVTANRNTMKTTGSRTHPWLTPMVTPKVFVLQQCYLCTEHSVGQGWRADNQNVPALRTIAYKSPYQTLSFDWQN